MEEIEALRLLEGMGDILTNSSTISSLGGILSSMSSVTVLSSIFKRDLYKIQV